MSRTSAVTKIQPQKIEIRLPELTDWQREIADSEKRFKVVCAGRQSGKTAFGAILCVGEAARGGHVWWVAPSFPIGELGWKIIDDLCRQIVDENGKQLCRFEQRPVFRITLPSGGTIQLRSADNPDSLRGATLTGVVFDEAAIAKPEAWPTLRPTLSVNRGWAMFISTPKGLNWFHDLYEDAASRDDWQRWRFPSTVNPYLDAADVEAARAEMSSLVFSQEYEADFISHGSGMFHSEWLQHYFTRFIGDERFFMLGDESVAESSCFKFQTIDLAWTAKESADYTVISTWAVTPLKHLILVDCVRDHFEGPDIVPQMSMSFTKNAPSYIAIEKATRQMSIVQEAERLGLPIRTLKAEKDKVARALPATARMERGTVWFPRVAEAQYMNDLEQELLSFPAGRHDDFVDTFAYACLELAKQQRSVYETRGVLSI